MKLGAAGEDVTQVPAVQLSDLDRRRVARRRRRHLRLARGYASSRPSPERLPEGAVDRSRPELDRARERRVGTFTKLATRRWVSRSRPSRRRR